MNLAAPDLETFWLGALLAVPVVTGVALVCRLGVRSPATRHALWVVALLAFIAPGVVSLTAAPEWLNAARESLAPAPIEPRPTGVTPSRPERADSIGLDRWEPAPGGNGVRARAAPRASWPAFARPERNAATPRAAPGVTTDAFFRAPDRAEPAPADRRADPRSETPLIASPAGPSTTTPERRPGFVSDDPPTLAERLEGARAQFETWGAWGARLLADVRRVPPMPGAVWLLGGALALLAAILRITRDSSAFRASCQPTERDERLLATAADRIGLARPPTLRFVARRISPMVTCGPRPRLIVPDTLWRTLDDDARLAVLLHELAHLRRRDHWTHWLSVGVGLLYWWHPLAWYVRSRLADEADLACDTWVTALMPTRRRAYATALLEAASFAHASPRCAGASLAMASSSTRRLTRRLTMVMTHTVRPRPGAIGRSLVAAAAILALLVLPGVACPPEDKQPPKSPPAHGPHDEPGSTFDQHMRSRAAGPDAPADRAALMARLAERMAELEARLAHLGDIARPAPTPPRAPEPERPADAPRHLSLRGFAFTPESDSTIARAYVLPRGRLEDLTRLMTRSDVPILVSPGDERIVVHAVPRDHATFSAFAAMICPEGVKVIDVETGREIRPRLGSPGFEGIHPGLAAPGLSGEFAVIVRSDHAAHAKAHAQECETHECDNECCEESCEGECEDECEDEWECEWESSVVPDSLRERLIGDYKAQLESMRVRLRDLDASKQRLGDRLTQSRRAQSDLERHLAQYEREAERMVDRAETARERADECRADAADLETEARELSETGRAERAERALARAADLRARADQMRAQSDEFRARADAARAQADESERAHDQSEDQTDQIRDMIEALSDEIEHIRDALEELAEDLAGSLR